jgi:hypothetical protein
MIKALIWGDKHTGANSGLTPPRRWCDDYRETQTRLWEFARGLLREAGPFDLEIDLGDAVDGQGRRDSIGQLVMDTKIQAELAAECSHLVRIPCGCRYLDYGTPYHTVGSYSYEEAVAEKTGADIRDGHLLRIGGVRVNTRHTQGRSEIPYGQGTPLYKEAVRDQLDAVLSHTEEADLVLRGHDHYSARMDIGEKSAIAVPCLQWPDSVFGRKCKAQYYHIGIGVLTVRRPDDWEYRPLLMALKIVRRREWQDVRVGKSPSKSTKS